MNTKTSRFFNKRNKSLFHLLGGLLGISMVYVTVYQLWLREIANITYTARYGLLYHFVVLPVVYFSAMALLSGFGLNWIKADIDLKKQQLVKWLAVFLISVYISMVVIFFSGRVILPSFLYSTLIEPFFPILVGVTAGVGFLAKSEENEN